MATMFGSQRQLGVSPMQQSQPMWGGYQGAILHGIPFRPPTNPGLFSANAGIGFGGVQQNIDSLQRLGDRQFAGFQAQQDRDLESNLLNAQLRNALQLQGMRGQNNLDLQGLVNSGALDQINARGGWDRTLQGDALSSQERRLAQQLGFDQYALNANLGSQAADRSSRERMHGAGLSNALQLQSMSDASAFDRLRAQLTGQQNIAGMEIGARAQLQDTIGRQQMDQLGARGRMELGMQRLRGQQSLEELETQAGYTARNLAQQLGLQRELGLGAQDTQRYVADQNAATQMFDAQMRHQLGMEGLANQLYGFDTNYDIASMRNAQDAAQFDRELEFRRGQANDQALYNENRLAEDRRQFDNPQVAPPPTVLQMQQKALETAAGSLPDGSPDEILGLAERIFDLYQNAGSIGQGQPGQPRPVRQPSARQLMDNSAQRDLLMRQTPSQLVEALAPILPGVQYDEQGRVTPGSRQQLEQRGIDADVLDRLNGYEPTLSWDNVGPLSFLPWMVMGESGSAGKRRRATQDQGRRLRQALMPQ